jgi:hypothetical protein
MSASPAGRAIRAIRAWPVTLARPEDGATFASHLALPAAEFPAADFPAGRPPAGSPAPARKWPHRGRARQSHDAVLGLAGRATAAVVLVGAGAALGVVLSNSHQGSSVSAGTSGGLAGSLSPQAARRQPGAPQAPPSSFPVLPTGVAAIGMVQPFGDGATGFVLHGTGWPPGRRVTVALAGVGVAAFRPLTDRVGTFNYTIDQDHAFFPGFMPPGVYHVVVTGPGRRHATTHFQVAPAPRPGDPNSGPPPGIGPPGSGPAA